MLDSAQRINAYLLGVTEPFPSIAIPMNEPSDKAAPTIAVSQLFARQYVERGAPVQDNAFFRSRLDAFLQAGHFKDYTELAAYLRQESGLVVGPFYSDTYKSVSYKFTDFFAKTKDRTRTKCGDADLAVPPEKIP